MKISELAGPETANLGAIGSTEVSGVTADSRQVSPGQLFVALAGSKTDGSAFVRDAVEKGATAVVVAEGVSVDAGVPVVAVAEPRRFLALAASRLFARQPETMVAVTGTAGKTSVASFRKSFASAIGSSRSVRR